MHSMPWPAEDWTPHSVRLGGVAGGTGGVRSLAFSAQMSLKCRPVCARLINFDNFLFLALVVGRRPLEILIMTHCTDGARPSQAAASPWKHNDRVQVRPGSAVSLSRSGLAAQCSCPGQAWQCSVPVKARPGSGWAPGSAALGQLSGVKCQVLAQLLGGHWGTVEKGQAGESQALHQEHVQAALQRAV